MRGKTTELVQFHRSIVAQSFSDDATITGVGMFVRDGESLAVILDVSELGGANGTVDAKLQTSDELGANYEDIAGAAFPQITDASGDASQKVAHLNCNSPLVKKYVRILVTVAGDTPTGVIQCLFALGRNSETPVTQALSFNV